MNEQPKPSIFICVPAYGQIVNSQLLSSCVALTRALDQHGMNGGFGTLSYPDIEEIRNIFVTLFYDKVQASHLLFLDSDMAFPPELILEMIAFNQPIVGALCPKKKLPIEFAGRAKQGDARIVNGFMEVNGVGMAITLISREVITAMLQKWPELSDTITIKNHAAKSILDANGITRMLTPFNKLSINGEKFSEDLSFCHRWNQCGGQVWANITHDITHVGLYEYRGNYHEKIKEQIRPFEGPPPVLPMFKPIGVDTSVTGEVVGTMVPPIHTNGAGVPA